MTVERLQPVSRFGMPKTFRVDEGSLITTHRGWQRLAGTIKVYRPAQPVKQHSCIWRTTQNRAFGHGDLQRLRNSKSPYLQVAKATLISLPFDGGQLALALPPYGGFLSHYEGIFEPRDGEL